MMYTSHLAPRIDLERCWNEAAITTMYLARLAVPQEEVEIQQHISPYGRVEVVVSGVGQVGVYVCSEEGSKSHFDFHYGEGRQIDFKTAVDDGEPIMQIETKEATYLPTAYTELVALNNILQRVTDTRNADTVLDARRTISARDALQPRTEVI